MLLSASEESVTDISASGVPCKFNINCLPMNGRDAQMQEIRGFRSSDRRYHHPNLTPSSVVINIIQLVSKDSTHSESVYSRLKSIKLLRFCSKSM